MPTATVSNGLATIAIVVATLAGTNWPGDDSSRPPAPDFRSDARSPRASLLEPGNVSFAPRSLARMSPAWRGGLSQTSTGSQLTVYVSESYEPSEVSPQAWADFFGALLHGAELALLTAYIAPLEEVEELCGSTQVLGCYGSNQLAITGEAVGGITPEEVARHEYGHHVAANAVNPPWRALDWGTKRWASRADVCARAAAGTAFPGDEQDHYAQNPGEAFAESYRALNESKAGVSVFDWQIVAPSFYPNAAALAAVEDDVLRPWTSSSRTTVTGRLGVRAAWVRKLATPLDGVLTITLRLPSVAATGLELVASGKVIATGSWSGPREQRVSMVVCGQRYVEIRLQRRGYRGRFSLSIEKP